MPGVVFLGVLQTVGTICQHWCFQYWDKKKKTSENQFLPDHHLNHRWKRYELRNTAEWKKKRRNKEQKNKETYLRGSLKRTVAAQWKTMLMFSTRTLWSSLLRSSSCRVRSLFTAMIFSAKSGCSACNFSNSWKENVLHPNDARVDVHSNKNKGWDFLSFTLRLVNVRRLLHQLKENPIKFKHGLLKRFNILVLYLFLIKRNNTWTLIRTSGFQ